MNRLIKMSDYNKEQELSLRNNSEYTNEEALVSIFKATDFIQQKLNIGMFVPCYLDGNVLVKPVFYEMYIKGKHELFTMDEYNLCKQYQKAKERVIFKGFVLFGKDVLEFSSGRLFELSFLENHTIEDLIPYNLELIKPFL
jgi:hypothetical protein